MPDVAPTRGPTARRIAEGRLDWAVRMGSRPIPGRFDRRLPKDVFAGDTQMRAGGCPAGSPSPRRAWARDRELVAGWSGSPAEACPPSASPGRLARAAASRAGGQVAPEPLDTTSAGGCGLARIGTGFPRLGRLPRGRCPASGPSTPAAARPCARPVFRFTSRSGRERLPGTRRMRRGCWRTRPRPGRTLIVKSCREDDSCTTLLDKTEVRLCAPRHATRHRPRPPGCELSTMPPNLDEGPRHQRQAFGHPSDHADPATMSALLATSQDGLSRAGMTSSSWRWFDFRWESALPSSCNPMRAGSPSPRRASSPHLGDSSGSCSGQ